jgi:glycosyltransferase involved in cell wall biosynthesis
LQAYTKSGIKQKLLLLGDGPLKDSIQQLAHKLGISENLIFAGFHSNPYPIIRGAKLCILTSDYEGLPTALIESLALHVPVLSTDCPSGPREILTGALAKNLINSGDIDTIAKTINNTLTTSLDLNYTDELLVNRFGSQHSTANYLSLSR